METFRIAAVPGEDNCTLVLAGEADLAVAADIVELGTISLNEPTTLTLTVDLAAVTFIDSTCIAHWSGFATSPTQTANEWSSRTCRLECSRFSRSPA